MIYEVDKEWSISVIPQPNRKVFVEVRHNHEGGYMCQSARGMVETKKCASCGAVFSDFGIAMVGLLEYYAFD